MRIKTIEDLQDTFYPSHMLWVPVQDIKEYLVTKEEKKVIDDIKGYNSPEKRWIVSSRDMYEAIELKEREMSIEKGSIRGGEKE